MKRLLVFMASAILLPCLSAQTGASVDIIRNHKTALSHVFDPATAADAFLIPIDQTGEMPMPTGINAFVFATYYNRSVNVATNTILISTVLSVVTVSIWLYLLGL